MPIRHSRAALSALALLSALPAAAQEACTTYTVKEGDTLCIIEAMKILNEIDAEKGGTIKKILGENGQAVEYGQPLFIIE